MKRVPIFRGIDLVTSLPTHLKYGVTSGYGDGPFVHNIKRVPWTQYMDAYPGHLAGLWGVAQTIGNQLGLVLEPEVLKTKYADMKWHIT